MESVASPLNRTSNFLTSSEKMTGDRERPKTMLTPDGKRTKIGYTISPPPIVDYPTVVPIPSKSLIKALYDATIEGSWERLNESHSDGEKEYNDQIYLAPAGILSFAKVLLPAIGLEEENALKRIQSKLQRDAPEYKFLMENCRALVRESVRSAMHGVHSSRSTRFQRQRERKHNRLLETERSRESQHRAKEEEQVRLAKELAHKKEISRIEKKRNLAKDHPKNQKIWKEIVFLTSSVAQLEREERMWIQIEKDIMRLESSKQFFPGEKDAGGDVHQHSNGFESSLSKADAVVLKAQKSSYENKIEVVVKDVMLTSTRIQKGLETMLKNLHGSIASRNELYNRYKKDHFFDGYLSVRNPKNLIRFLSQSQDDNV